MAIIFISIHYSQLYMYMENLYNYLKNRRKKYIDKFMWYNYFMR
jgi:hypothetical protein